MIRDLVGEVPPPSREPIRPPVTPSATRYATNPNWSYRGDNAKPKGKK